MLWVKFENVEYGRKSCSVVQVAVDADDGEEGLESKAGDGLDFIDEQEGREVIFASASTWSLRSSPNA